MKAAIVVPVHNAYDYTQRCLEQIRKTVPHGVPLVLIDDDCDAETGDYLYHYRAERLQPDDVKREVYEERPITLLYNSRQQLFTRSANRGIRYAYHHYKADIILVVNTDCDLRQDWYELLLRGMEWDVQAGIIGYRDGPDPKETDHYTQVSHPGYITGHCIALRTAALEQIGVFCETDVDGREDPVLAPFKGQAHIGSERIWAWKAMKAGWKSFYCNAPVVFHAAGKSWNHDLGWLSRFDLQPAWEPCDALDKPRWINDCDCDHHPEFVD